MLKARFLFGVSLILVVLMSGQAGTQNNGQKTDASFHNYWYQGKAELTRYALDQGRYGEIHKGEAVLIFVTEPFLTDKQVKYEEGDRSKAISVLKLNFVRKFFTGIYPYSLMTSIFSPVDYQRYRTLKVSSTTQEFCGNTFMQLNFRDDKYHALLRSYFQDESDQDFDVTSSWLEDEIWTRIRLAPQTLPSGEVDMVPSLQFARLWHVPLRAEKATVSLTAVKSGSGKPLQQLKVDYKNIRRHLTIRFEKDFPYTIVEWEEQQPGGFGDSPLLTTKAVKTNSVLLDYWNKHGVKDSIYRDQLGLTMK